MQLHLLKAAFFVSRQQGFVEFVRKWHSDGQKMKIWQHVLLEQMWNKLTSVLLTRYSE